MRMKTFIYYSTQNLLTDYKVCLWFYCLYHRLFNVCGDEIYVDFVGFLIHDNLRSFIYMIYLGYNICSAWFLNIRILTCSTLCWSTLHHRDPWAMAISQLMLTINSHNVGFCVPDGITWHAPILCLYWVL